MASRRRPPSRAARAKGAVLFGALVVTGVCEFLEGVEAGDSPLKAADKAYRRTKVRKRAIRKAAKEAAPELERIDEED